MAQRVSAPRVASAAAWACFGLASVVAGGALGEPAGEDAASRAGADPSTNVAAEEADPLDRTDAPAPPNLPEPENAKRLTPGDMTWIDLKRGCVYVDGYISLREGYLEMFACLVGTKEHESIVAARTKAATVHAALLAVGAEARHPVQYRPNFVPASGSEIDVEVRWLDDAGQWKSVRAQEWIKNLRTKKGMTEPWVFGGSGFWIDEKTGKKHYMAETGDFICVSNFTTAMMDIPVESSQANEGLLFAADPEKIPPLETPVRLVLTPRKTPPPAGVEAAK